MADLAKYGEVDEVDIDSSNDTDNLNWLNERLRDGWEVVTVKIIEKQYRCSGGDESYIKKEASTRYVIGKPREKPQPNRGPNPAK